MILENQVNYSLQRMYRIKSHQNVSNNEINVFQLSRKIIEAIMHVGKSVQLVAAEDAAT